MASSVIPGDQAEDSGKIYQVEARVVGEEKAAGEIQRIIDEIGGYDPSSAVVSCQKRIPTDMARDAIHMGTLPKTLIQLAEDIAKDGATHADLMMAPDRVIIMDVLSMPTSALKKAEDCGAVITPQQLAADHAAVADIAWPVMPSCYCYPGTTFGQREEEIRQVLMKAWNYGLLNLPVIEPWSEAPTEPTDRWVVKDAGYILELIALAAFLQHGVIGFPMPVYMKPTGEKFEEVDPPDDVYEKCEPGVEGAILFAVIAKDGPFFLSGHGARSEHDLLFINRCYKAVKNGGGRLLIEGLTIEEKTHEQSCARIYELGQVSQLAAACHYPKPTAEESKAAFDRKIKDYGYLNLELDARCGEKVIALLERATKNAVEGDLVDAWNLFMLAIAMDELREG
jgi:hypothetical protein